MGLAALLLRVAQARAEARAVRCPAGLLRCHQARALRRQPIQVAVGRWDRERLRVQPDHLAEWASIAQSICRMRWDGWPAQRPHLASKAGNVWLRLGEG